MKIKFRTIILFFLMGIGLAGCHFWDNFTTYFNTYYNMDRLMFETEDEFEYLEEKKRVTPRLLVPEPDVYFAEESSTGAPPFMQEFVISQQKLQPVKIKLDSILIKGSKILAHHPKSDYVEGSLFLMAKAYFYRSEWLPSQIKCSELIDKFPAGDFSPDAHLLMAKNYLIQRKFHAGKILLSRTVDIAWIKDRYDILSEAFRLEADLALYLGEEEKALIPYRQAIVQTDDGLMKAKWQVELASLLFRMGKFKKAAVEFAKVQNYDPDYQAEFEGYLYQASSLLRIGQFERADEILEDLEGDGNNEEWLDYIYAQRMNELRLKDNTEDLEKAEDYADSVYINKPPITVTYFEIGMDYFKDYDYMEARKYFARAKNVRSPIFRTAGKLYELLNAWDRERTYAMPLVQKLDQKDTIPDEEYPKLASSLFHLGRIHTQIGNPDSALYYYDKSVEITPRQDETSARYYYAYARAIEDDDPVKSDSLMTVLVDRYPFTEYGEDAADRLGYTDDFVIDTVKEIYSSGAKLRKHGDYQFAISQFNKVYDKYPDSEYAPKSLYTIGWLYENDYAKMKMFSPEYVSLYERMIDSLNRTFDEDFEENYIMTDEQKKMAEYKKEAEKKMQQRYMDTLRVKDSAAYAFQLRQDSIKQALEEKYVLPDSLTKEFRFAHIDSALHYYQLLIEDYPDTEYARDVKLSVDYLLALRSGNPLPDSLKKKKFKKYNAKPFNPVEMPELKLSEKPGGPGKNNQLSPENIIKDPTSIFKSAKDAISNPGKLLNKDIKLPDISTDPKDLINLPESEGGESGKSAEENARQQREKEMQETGGSEDKKEKEK